MAFAPWRFAAGVLAVALALSCSGVGGNGDAGDGGHTDAGNSPSDAGDTTSLPSLETFDVVVVGAGTSGASAAIQAGRMGVRVALLEETDCVGGQMNCAGVTSMDEGDPTAERQDGIYKEFVDRIRVAYGARPIGTCYWSDTGICFEPNVGQSVLRQMLSEAGVNLYTRKQIVGFTAGDFSVVSTAQNNRFAARVVIDATEYGDLLPLAGVDYRVGNSLASTGLNPTACVQDITYTAVLKKYPNGVPPNLKMSSPPGGADSYNAQLPKFRSYIAVNGTNTFGGGTPGSPPYPYSWDIHTAYRGMPDSTNPTFYTALQSQMALITKTGVNWANDYPYTVAALERVNRQAANCEAKLETLQFLYYAQTELGQTLWSVADDTGYDTPYNIEDNSCANIGADFKELEKRMPPMPYVREARRLVGINTLVASDIARVATPSGMMSQKNWPDSVSMGHYPNDLHHCDGADTLETFESESDFQPAAHGPFQIPLSALIPANLDGLIAAEKNFSQSRLVSAATRLQPSTMLVGQAAGALAALAAQGHIPPRQVPAIQVQDALLAANHRISRFDYSDVPRSSPYWADIQLTSLRGAMLGYGGSPPAFGPDDKLTRRQAAATVVNFRSYTVSPPPTRATFSDVPTTDSTFAQIEAAWREGLTSGCAYASGVRSYCPDSNMTRGAMAVFLSRAFSLPLITTGNTFDDTAGHPYHDYIQALAVLNLAEPCPNAPSSYCPDQEMTRADAAAMIARIVRAGTIAPPKQTITVVAGTYGANVGNASGNATTALVNACAGKLSCVYTINPPSFGIAVAPPTKDYLAEWTCNPNGPTMRAWYPAESNGGTVTLSCQ